MILSSPNGTLPIGLSSSTCFRTLLVRLRNLTFDSIVYKLGKMPLPRKATGYDGWSPDELRCLKGYQLMDLAEPFQTCAITGFPRHLAQARVSTLSKVDSPKSMADGRPITIFSCTYRLWSSLLSKKVFRAWADWLPQSVAGSIPGRSVQDISYFLQAQVEEALQQQLPRGGFSLDIIKAFNNVPRAPVIALLRHLGFPSSILSVWQSTEMS